ncbi:MAG: hypothetical protein DSM106950_35645 [Stigonema ocellatum SAG 48.90 = DSM 106950]|nr:hypothetical protein [Stigonema ocellatum SAG 48.90 = DSM 106950]
MKRSHQQHHTIEVSPLDTLSHQIDRERIVLGISDEHNTIAIVFPIKDGKLFQILGDIRESIADAMTAGVRVEADDPDPLLLLSDGNN